MSHVDSVFNIKKNIQTIMLFLKKKENLRPRLFIYHDLINLIKVVLDRRESPQILFEYD
jgi:hypothetical protein